MLDLRVRGWERLNSTVEVLSGRRKNPQLQVGLLGPLRLRDQALSASEIRVHERCQWAKHGIIHLTGCCIASCLRLYVLAREHVQGCRCGGMGEPRIHVDAGL